MALLYINKGLEYREDSQNLLSMKVEVLTVLKKFNEAMEIIDYLLEKDPDFYEILMQKSICLKIKEVSEYDLLKESKNLKYQKMYDKAHEHLSKGEFE